MVRLQFDIPDYLSSIEGSLAFGFGAGIRRQIVLSLANAHVKAVKDEAKANAPVKSGRLRDSIQARFLNERLGVLEATAPHAKYLHYGTGIYGRKNEAINIKPKQKKALHWPGAKHPVKRVRQQGIKPHDFLRMAMEQKRIEDRMRPVVQNIIREAVIERMKSIIREAANLDARAPKSRSRDAEKRETNGFNDMPGSFGNVPADFSYRPRSNFFTMSPGMIEFEARRGKNPRNPVDTSGLEDERSPYGEYRMPPDLGFWQKTKNFFYEDYYLWRFDDSPNAKVDIGMKYLGYITDILSGAAGTHESALRGLISNNIFRWGKGTWAGGSGYHIHLAPAMEHHLTLQWKTWKQWAYHSLAKSRRQFYKIKNHLN